MPLTYSRFNRTISLGSKHFHAGRSYMYYSNVLTVTVSSWTIARWKPFGILLNGMTTHTFGITERDDNPYHLVLLNGITTLTFGTIKWDDNPYLWNY